MRGGRGASLWDGRGSKHSSFVLIQGVAAVHAAVAFPTWVSCKSHTGVEKISFASPEKCKLQGCFQLLSKQSSLTLLASFPYQKADSVSFLTAERFCRI